MILLNIKKIFHSWYLRIGFIGYLCCYLLSTFSSLYVLDIETHSYPDVSLSSRARDWIERSDLTNVLGDATRGPRVLREPGPRSKYYLYQIIGTLTAQIQPVWYSSSVVYV